MTSSKEWPAQGRIVLSFSHKRLKSDDAKLNALSQVTTAVDGLDIHFIHVRSKDLKDQGVAGLACRSDFVRRSEFDKLIAKRSNSSSVTTNAGISTPGDGRRLPSSPGTNVCQPCAV